MEINEHIKSSIRIGNRRIGSSEPIYFIAEMSANHNQNFDQAVEIVKAAKEAGADAIKVQTYTPDTLTINCDNQHFRINQGTIWEGRTLYNLYCEAQTPWEWQPKLKKIAGRLGLDFFSTPFDSTAIDFLEGINVPAYKIASFEITDLPLIRRIAQTNKPIIMSTGMATLAEIDEAVLTIREIGNNQIAMLKCTSAYPARTEEMNLKTIPHLSETFNVPVGLSDHTIGTTVPIAAAAVGASIIEKHFTLSRKIPGPDSSFSMEPTEFKKMVNSVRNTEKALGKIYYGASENEKVSLNFRRSLFVTEDIKAGEKFTKESVRSIRPGYGLHPRYYEKVIGRYAQQDVKCGTPLSWDLIKPDNQ